MSPTGKERVLHKVDEIDGAYPEYGLLALSGKLYGTAANGGSYNLGTVFEFTP